MSTPGRAQLRVRLPVASTTMTFYCADGSTTLPDTLYASEDSTTPLSPITTDAN